MGMISKIKGKLRRRRLRKDLEVQMKINNQLIEFYVDRNKIIEKILNNKISIEKYFERGFN